MPSTPALPQAASSFETRRLQLLVSKQQQAMAGRTRIGQQSGGSLKQRLKAELAKLLELRGTVDHKTNPQHWWKEHCSEYPLLGRYYRGHCAFPATSTNAERVFNMESLVVTPSRKNLLPSRVADLCESRDYLLQRQKTSAFRICKKCPQPPSSAASYVICCKKHNI